MAERLPTLYPMPRDPGQWRASVDAARDAPTREVYRERLSSSLLKLEGEKYGDAMLDKIESNLLHKGFLSLDAGVVKLPKHAAEWNGEESGLAQYIGKSLMTWGEEFHDGLQLAIDLLSLMGAEGLAESALTDKLLARDDDEEGTGRGGRWDPHDSTASRTIREVLKLLVYAGWATYHEKQYRITKEGRRARAKLRNLDPIYRVEKLLQEVDPVESKFLTDQQKIDIGKFYIFRQSGGKYSGEPVKRAHDAVFSAPGKLKKKVQDERKRLRAERENLKQQIAEKDPEIERTIRNLRNTGRLRGILQAIESGDQDALDRLLTEGGATLGWNSLKRPRHTGEPYTTRRSIVPHAWQLEALEAWGRANRRGVLAVVTGAGKTVFALQAIARLHSDLPDLRVSILVPTKVLMYQWTRELVRILAVPVEDIGLRGDGHKDSFANGKRVMVCVVNSAIQDDYLKNDVATIPETVPHFLIADECHRYRGEEFRRAFSCRKTHTLGLSATPVDPSTESGPPGAADAEAERDVLTDELGPPFYRYTYKRALAEGIIQEFVTKYVGVELTSAERAAYDQYTKKISKALQKIRQRYGPRLDSMRAKTLDQKLQALLKSDTSPDPAIGDYFRFVRERKDLVFGCVNRKKAYLDIIYKHTVDKLETDQDKVIVFHERIEQLEDIVAPHDRRKKLPSEMKQPDPEEDNANRLLVKLFLSRRFKPVMYHSRHARLMWNQVGMDWFRADVANVMLSVKALIEGVDVPAANVGIIRASSSSVRQRIQTTGRILRKHQGKDKPSVLYVLYARDTTDERIFRGVNWFEELGNSAIESWHWYPPTVPDEPHGRWENQEGKLPQVEPERDETPYDVSVEHLSVGDEYPGVYAGLEYHVDAKGRPFKATRDGRAFISTPELVAAALKIREIKGGGRFVVTHQNHIVTRVAGRKLMYLGTAPEKMDSAPKPAKAIPKLDDKAPSFDDLFK